MKNKHFSFHVIGNLRVDSKHVGCVPIASFNVKSVVLGKRLLPIVSIGFESFVKNVGRNRNVDVYIQQIFRVTHAVSMPENIDLHESHVDGFREAKNTVEFG